MNDPIVITGAAGLVGRAVCAELARHGMPILPVMRVRGADAPADALTVDLAASDLLQSTGKRVGAIVHLAAAVPHSALYSDSEETASMTRAMDANVLRAARAWDCPVVYMSTCGLYDRRFAEVKHESRTDYIRVESPYFAAKLAGEELFLCNATAIIARLSAPLGPGLKSSVVAARFITAAREDATIELWGSGLREQDFIDVADVASFVRAAVERPCSAIANVAAGVPTTMVRLAELVVGIVGRGRVAFAAKPDPRDDETARYSIERAKELFDWSPQRTLPQALRALIHESFAS